MAAHSRSASLLLAAALAVLLLAGGACANGRALQEEDVLAPAPEAATAAPAPAPGPEVSVGEGASLMSSEVAYTGQVLTFATPSCPQGTLPMSGQMLNPGQYQALFSLIGTTYGGDGRSSFALPNMNGRFPVGTGRDMQGGFYTLGSTGGRSMETIMDNQMPPHVHMVSTAFVAGQPLPADTSKDRFPVFVPYQQSDVPVGQAPIQLPRYPQPMNNLPPYLPLTYCIVVNGLYPTF